MTTKAKILSGVVLSTVLATGLYANCGMQKHKGMNDNNKSSCQMQHNKKMMKKSHHKNPIMKMVRQLDLTKEQRTSIKQIMMENKQNRKNMNKQSMSEAFSKTSFDKTKFIDIMKMKKDAKIESKANTIEKIYSILNPKQKEYLKVLIEKRHDNKEKRFNKKG